MVLDLMAATESRVAPSETKIEAPCLPRSCCEMPGATVKKRTTLGPINWPCLRQRWQAAAKRKAEPTKPDSSDDDDSQR